MITNTKNAWKWRSKCKEKERIVDLGPNNEQLTYLHFFVRSFVRSFVCTFVRSFICTFVRLYVHSFSRSMFVRLYCMINTSTRGKQHKKIAFPHARSLGCVCAHGAHATPLADAACRRRLHIPRIVARSLGCACAHATQLAHAKNWTNAMPDA